MFHKAPLSEIQEEEEPEESKMNPNKTADISHLGLLQFEIE